MIGYVLIGLALVVALGLALSVRILKQYERGVLFRLGRVKEPARGPGLIVFIPLVDRVHRVSMRIITMPIESQGIITRDNVSIDVSAVAYYRVADPIRSVVAIENVAEAINQIAQTTLRAVVGRHTLDQTLSETDSINQNICEILDVQTEEWGIKVTLVELKDIQLPETMKRAMARQAEAEREKRAKIIAAEGEALAAGELAHASDVMMAHPLALQLRNLQTLVEIAVDKNSTVVFPAPLMSTIQELGAFLSRETTAAGGLPGAHTALPASKRGSGPGLSAPERVARPRRLPSGTRGHHSRKRSRAPFGREHRSDTNTVRIRTPFGYEHRSNTNTVRIAWTADATLPRRSGGRAPSRPGRRPTRSTTDTRARCRSASAATVPGSPAGAAGFRTRHRRTSRVPHRSR
jgi:regulator of protease activity HflC (stomatin/prohibitin superfamily)